MHGRGWKLGDQQLITKFCHHIIVYNIHNSGFARLTARSDELATVPCLDIG